MTTIIRDKDGTWKMHPKWLCGLALQNSQFGALSTETSHQEFKTKVLQK